jgi:hypothetical protein
VRFDPVSGLSWCYGRSGEMGLRRRISFAAALAAVVVLFPAPAHATFPGENGKIAFSARMVDDTSNEIYTINPDGTDLTRITDAPGDDIEPSWSPDGTKLVFASERDEDPCAPGICAELYSMNADGTQPTRLTTTPAVHETDPVWSPDGQEIAYSSRQGSTTATVVSLMNADGTNQHTLFASDQSRAHGPSWSPDGDRIAYEDGGIRVGNRDGSGARFVGNGELPNWSPYHNLILVVVNDFRRELRALSPDDDRPDIVVPVGTPLVPSSAVWSPDMDGVAVAVGNAIHLMRSDGTQRSNLIATDGLVYGIDWLAIPATIPGYPRAQSATPLLVPLVPAYRECTAPDRVHGPPLESPSCSHPTQSSEVVTVGTFDANGQPSRSVGSVRISARPGDPTMHADEADIRLTLDVTDVRRKRDLADYGGILLVPLDIRLTDRYNGCCRVGGPHAATVAEGWVRDALSFGAPCVATADPNAGARCSVATTVEAIAPAVVLEGVRSTWQLGQIQVFAGEGEPSPFLVQGLFVP